MRSSLVVLTAGTIIAAALISVPGVEAACNVIPFSVTKPSEADRYFHGTLGRLTSPFVIPGEALGITRRPCDTAGVDFAYTTPATVRTIVVLRPPTGDPRALVLKQGTGDCTDDAFTKNCAAALGGATRATCFSVDTASYTIAQKTLSVAFPDPNPAATPVRTTGGRATVAVVEETESGEVCAALALPQPGRCDEAVKGATFPTLSACIDDIRKPAMADACPQDLPHPSFAEVSLLPVPNNVHELCKDASATGLCKASLANEFRYALDREGNGLVPVYWKDSLAACSKECKKLSLRAELRPPRTADFRENEPFLLRNVWLQSFTYAGGRNYPSFALDSPSNPDDATLRAFSGTADEHTSVLRFSNFFGKCSATTDRCNSALECGGAGCDRRCRNTFAACSAAQPCPSGAGPCGRNFDFTNAYGNGRWRLDRTTNVLCHEDPAKSCASDADCDCVSFVVTIDQCDCSDPKPEVTASPAPMNATVAAPLIEALQVPQADVIARAASREVLAALVPRKSLGSQAPERCRRGSEPTVLAVARRTDCEAAASCAVSCPDLGRGELLPRVAVAGTQVRLLQRAEQVKSSRRWWERLWYWLTGGGRKPTATTELAALRLIDLRSSTERVVTVADVVTSHAGYDPLATSASGGSSFLIKAGRCQTSDGRTLGIPSLCFPEQPGACPAWASCKADDVVIATDLALDDDADGVPDVIDPSVQARMRTR